MHTDGIGAVVVRYKASNQQKKYRVKTRVDANIELHQGMVFRCIPTALCLLLVFACLLIQVQEYVH